MESDRRKRILKFCVLAAALAFAAYVQMQSPHPQRLNFVLGAAAHTVKGIELEYIAPGGEGAITARFAYEQASAPRILAHAPELPDGDYQVRIDVDTREGHRSAERRVTLGGRTVQVDLTGVLQSNAAPTRISP